MVWSILRYKDRLKRCFKKLKIMPKFLSPHIPSPPGLFLSFLLVLHQWLLILLTRLDFNLNISKIFFFFDLQKQPFEDTLQNSLRAGNFFKKRCFPVNNAKFLGTAFYITHIRWLLLDLAFSRLLLEKFKETIKTLNYFLLDQ